MFRRFVLVACITFAALSAHASPSPQYRGFWVETFNTDLGSHAAVDRVVDAAVKANANAIFAQVRRRGDAWFLEKREPLTEVDAVGEPDANGKPTFDPLRYLIERAHARGIEVHAFTIIGSIYREDPRRVLPRDPTHAFLNHVWDARAQRPYDLTSRTQWATRALPYNARGTTYDGQRFGEEWYIDLGHPDAAAYTVDVLTHLAREYDLDGIHLDRIRYPEAPEDRGGINVGYNATSVARFRARFGGAASYDADGFPRANDPLWNQWRRDQVTAFVRRLYLSVKAVRPAIKVSAAVICFGTGPSASGGFERTEAYGRVFQDWKRWVEEGIVDLIAPMNYKREATPKQAAQFDDWMRFASATARANGRIALIGVGAFLNPIEATIKQARRALSEADGVIFYSLATTNVGRRRSPEAFFAALTTQSDMFAKPAAPPELRVRDGHLMGFVRDANGNAFDGAGVAIESLDGAGSRTTTTDGGGFYGVAHLPPGHYRVTAKTGDAILGARDVVIGVNQVTTADISK